MGGNVNLYHYKTWVVSSVLDQYELFKKEKGKLEMGKLYVVPGGEPSNRNAYFERFVFFTKDVEKILEEMDEELREIILKRYFEGDSSTYMLDKGLKSKREARSLIIKAVNTFFHRLERVRRDIIKRAV